VDLNDAPADLVAIVAELDENALEIVDTALLPGWDATPPDVSVRFGSDWARERRSVALRVPSVVIPSEPNYVLNPEHPDFGHAVIIGPAQRFTFDQRLIRLIKS